MALKIVNVSGGLGSLALNGDTNWEFAPNSLRDRLEKHGVFVSPVTEHSFCARGLAPRAFYFNDPFATSSKPATTR